MSAIADNLPVRAYCVRLRDLPPSCRPGAQAAAPTDVALLARLLAADVARGVAVLSTCSRLEVYLAVPRAGAGRIVRSLVAEVLGDAAATPGVLVAHDGVDAIAHLFRTACGLDSPILGDVQVLAQVRAAFVRAQEAAALDPVLYELFRSAVRLGRRARHETSISAGGVGIATVVRDTVRERRGDRAHDAEVLVVGAGDAGASILDALARDGFARLTVVNRSKRRAAELGGGSVRVRPFSRLAEAVARADVVIGAVDGPTPVLDRTILRRTARDRLVIDVSRPRCTASDVPCDVVTLDDLIDRPTPERLRAVPAVAHACDEATRSFVAWLALRDVDGALRELYRDMDRLVEHVVGEVRAAGGADVSRLLRRRLWATLHPHVQEVRRVAGDLALAGAAGAVGAATGA